MRRNQIHGLPGIMLILIMLLAACGAEATPTVVNPLAQLIAAAKAEGALNVMTLPHNWCNYGEQITNYKQQYGLQVNEINPEGSSGDEIAAINANKKGDFSVAPDVLDMGLAFGPPAREDGLLLPYKVSTWSTILDTAKDADGYWYGSYYGVQVMEVNTDVVKELPQTWEDLLKPVYKGQVALTGDPRRSAQALNSVYATALSAGGSLTNAQPGLEFFAKLQQVGNFLPIIATQSTLAAGTTPIVLRWDFASLADRDDLKGHPGVATIVPRTGVLAGISIQAISAYAPHPNAAKLWMEHLYADAGQLSWLKGYCHPIRFNDMVKRDVIPADLAARLPAAGIYSAAQFPTIAQFAQAKEWITNNWEKVVGVDIK